MHLMLKQKMVRGIIARLLMIIDDTTVVPGDIVTVLDDLLKIARVEMIACGVHQMREYLYMALLIIPWKSERLRDIFKKNYDVTLKDKITMLLSRYIDVEFYGAIDGKYAIADIGERISKIIDCHLTDEHDVVAMFMACDHIKQKQQVDLHKELICVLFKNHFFLGIRSSELTVTFEPFIELYRVWHTCSKDKQDRTQLSFILRTNTRPPTKTKRSFFSIGKYFESDESSEGDYSDEGHGSCFARRKPKKVLSLEIYQTPRYLKMKADKLRVSTDEKDQNARYLMYESYMKTVQDCINF